MSSRPESSMSEYPASYPEHGYHACSACGYKAPHHSQKEMPENGWVLPFESLGYYAGFTDEVEVLLGSRESRFWTLCHDCVVKLLETFPLLGDSIEQGSHSQMGPNDAPCCRWAWKIDSSGPAPLTVLASLDGKHWAH